MNEDVSAISSHSKHRPFIHKVNLSSSARLVIHGIARVHGPGAVHAAIDFRHILREPYPLRSESRAA